MYTRITSVARLPLARRYVTGQPHKNKKIAIVLSGSGVYDGTEIQEAVSTMIAISQSGATYHCFAPNVNQHHVVDHSTGQETKEKRNVLVESARLARGHISKLADLQQTEFDGIILPGGFGAAKNLCDFAFTEDGNYTVIPELEKVLKDFHEAKKPIGLCCISPVIAAKVFPGCSVTIGNDAGTTKRIQDVGSQNVVKEITDVQIDKKNLLVTTPAYMYDKPVHKVFEGVTKMVNNVLQLTPLKE